MKNKTEHYFQTAGPEWVDESYNRELSVAQNRLDTVIRAIKSYKPKSILDIGCGDGRFLKDLDWIDVRAGIDYSESMLKLADNADNAISLNLIDINRDNSTEQLSQIGEFDILTMMGVVHYLDNPLESVTRLICCCHDQSKIFISFRNRLYNTRPDSKYYSSKLTLSDFSRLEVEKSIWKGVNYTTNNFIREVNAQTDAEALIQDMNSSISYQGVTDSDWNPEEFENWRQFTPLEAILLLKKAGFTTNTIIPLVKSDDISIDQLNNCSSFVVAASLA